MTDEQFGRFLAKVRPEPSGCWIWTAAMWCSTKNYGCMSIGNRKMASAHRLSYEHFIGPIPKGLALDHLCRQPSCVNPNHLEPVTHRVNILRGVGVAPRNSAKTHCHRGHPFDEGNTYINSLGGRVCRACKRLRAAAQVAF